MNTKTNNWKITKGCPQPLGVSKKLNGINFAVEVKKNQTCELLIYTKNSSKLYAVISLTEEYRYGNVLAVLIEEFPYEKYEYKYRINGIETLDPYALFIEGKRKFGMWKGEEEGALRCGFFADDFDWEGECRPCIPLNQIILYCMHVRGFTMHASSKAAAKGTFQGVLEKIPYLKQLGVNQIELMPIYEFEEIIPEECLEENRFRKNSNIPIINYWGYGKQNYYFAPKKTYASGQDTGNELKQLVKELHKNGIEIILEFYFTRETRISTKIECLKYWVMEYHIDGFHITGENPYINELLKEPLLADIKLYGASLNVQNLCDKRNKIEQQTAVYAIDYMISMRKFLKGDACELEEISYYMRRNHGWAGFVNYFACHDGFTMLDMVSYDHKHNEDNGEGNQDGWDYNCSWNCGVEGSTRKTKILELRKKQIKNAWLILMLSQGIPAILAGDEFCNSQKGNNNAYCQDNEVGWLNWKSPKYLEDMYEFVRQVIQIRQEHPVFHMPEEARLINDLEIGYPDISYHSEKAWFIDNRKPGHCLGVLYCGDYVNTPEQAGDDYFYVAYNMYWKKQEFALPDIPNNRKWQYLIDTDRNDSFIDGEFIPNDSRTLKVMPRSIVVLIGKKVQEDRKQARKTKKP